jgi:hypothetical protein
MSSHHTTSQVLLGIHTCFKYIYYLNPTFGSNENQRVSELGALSIGNNAGAVHQIRLCLLPSPFSADQQEPAIGRLGFEASATAATLNPPPLALPLDLLIFT